MIVLFRGEESTKNLHGRNRKVTLFAGTDKDGEYPSMGVGLLYTNAGDGPKGDIWGLVTPHDVVASYRGMKIAEAVPKFSLGTLAACWYAGQNRVHSSDERYVTEIETMIGADRRAAILNAPLPNFDDAIALMRERGINFDVDPFLEEAEKGNLTLTPPLEEAVQDFSEKHSC